MPLSKTLKTGFSIIEILVAIAILGLTAAAGYQVFFNIERMQYKAILASQDKDKPEAAFNQFFSIYNSNADLATAIEVLDMTPNIDPFENNNRFRNNRIRVLFDPDATDLGLDSNPGDLTADLVADYTFEDGNIAAGFGQGANVANPDDFIHDDYIASGNVTLPNSSDFDVNNDPITQTLKLFDMGGRIRGTWIGVAFINGEFFLRMRAGRGTVSENDNFSGPDRAIRSVAINSIPEFDGMEHNITWDIDTGDTPSQSPGRIRLWIDNRKVIDSESTCSEDLCHLGLEGEMPSWAGGNSGSWGNGGDCGGLTQVPGGTDVYDGPQQFQNCNPWPTAAGTLSVFRDQLIDEAAVPSTAEPQITLPLTNLSVSDDQAIYYRVFAIPEESCKFSGGNNFQYSFSCFDDDDYDRLKTDINNLLNTDSVPFFDIGMLDGALCRVTAYDPNTEILTLDENSSCPSNSDTTDPTAGQTVFFLPPRLVFYSSDFSLNFVQSVMENFAEPINRYGDIISDRKPENF
jgi:prepilin-type N-terminal cleavage/methylation domain-containing protein